MANYPESLIELALDHITLTNDGHFNRATPDSMPPYNGLYWTTKKGDTITISQYNSREYQVESDIDSTEIWDGDRLVGKIPYDSVYNGKGYY